MKKNALGRGVLGLTVSAAMVLGLSLAGASTASAVETVDLTKTNGIDIVISTDPAKRPIVGHKFKALKVADYSAATLNAADQTIADGVSVSTVGTYESAAENAITAAGGVFNSGQYANNAFAQVATDWSGYSGADTTSNSRGAHFDGMLRKFMTSFTADSTVQADLNSQTEVTATTSGATFSNLAQGLYVIVETSGAGVTGNKSIPMLVGTPIGTSGSNAVHIGNASSPELGKVEFKSENEPELTKTTSAQDVAIGDQVPFSVKTKVPSTVGYPLGGYLFRVTDAPGRGFDLPTSVTVLVNNRPVTSGVNTWTLTTDSGRHRFVVAFNGIMNSTTFPVGADIEIKYQLLVNSTADSTNINNNVSIRHSTNPNAPATPNNPPQNGPNVPGNSGSGDGDDANTGQTNTGNEQQVPGQSNNGNNNNGNNTSPQLYFYGFDINKQDKVSSAYLTGAKFTVRKSGVMDSLKFVKLGNGNFKKAVSNTCAVNNTTCVEELEVSDATSASLPDAPKGHLYIDGLAAGEYKIKETVQATNHSAVLPEFTETINSGTPDAPVFTYTSAPISDFGLITNVGTRNNPNDGTSKPLWETVRVDNVTNIAQLPITGGAGIILAVIVALGAGVTALVLVQVRRRRMASASAGLLTR
ncbi:hypothetical protein CRD60_04400 [Bifidobacterium aemilianum]|uniref:SpaA-like prealbumin fold domain-containing protein n=1 Tax=Bifidobacterium aemilianum TaxID=2493120 RepID=A0A366K839_9BIFI|nr:isopeptide-forming domain-containing fimbrial protein [Bifidobacterium aemilianum]RBP97834.1 hypothetical protein CRD60_04400 [Bifidobacterium aemilianum]